MDFAWNHRPCIAVSFDVDDVAAVCLAHALADAGEANLIAIGYNSGYPEGVGALDVLNRWYHRDVPLGAYKGSFGREPLDEGGDWVRGPYVGDLIRNWEPIITEHSMVPDAVEVYRRALTAAADRSVVLAAIGFPTNVMALLRSPADSISALSGRELIEQKVKQVVWQGGWYDSPVLSVPRKGNGKQTFNWNCGGEWYNHSGCYGSAREAVGGMPPSVQKIFSDVGDDVWTGSRLSWCAPLRNPCRQAFIDYLGFGNARPSWDPIVVLAA